jgi:predicted nucleic acid-binding protein
MYLLGHHWEAQKTLLEMIASDDLTVPGLDGIIGRTQSLMAKYRDVPMDFADASLVAVAEKNHWDTIFTLDTDFRVYRLGGRRAFQIVP